MRDNKASSRQRIAEAVETVRAATDAGNGAIDPETLALARIGENLARDRREAERVRALIVRDRIERARTARRAQARMEVAQGKFISLPDTRDTLPDEQLERAEFAVVEVDNPEGTVRDPISTIRRVSRIRILWRRGVIDDDMLAVCSWYRDRWEQSGLDPLISSTFEPKYGNGATEFGHLPRTQGQLEARDDFTLAQRAISTDVRNLFDAVVLHDMTIEDAGKLVRLGHRNSGAAFRRAALALYGAAWTLLPTDRAKLLQKIS